MVIGCWREWPNTTQFLGAVLAAQTVPKPQIPGFSGRFPAPAGKRPENPGICGFGTDCAAKTAPKNWVVFGHSRQQPCYR